MKAASALLQSDAGHCSDRVTLQRPMNTPSEESEKTRANRGEKERRGVSFFFTLLVFHLASLHLPSVPENTARRPKRGRIGVKKRLQFRLKLEQQPVGWALLLRWSSTICQENFNQRPLPYVSVSLSLFVSASLYQPLLTMKISTVVWYLLLWRLESPCRNTGNLCIEFEERLDSENRKVWNASRWIFLLRFFFSAEVIVLLSPLHFWGTFLCIKFKPELQCRVTLLSATVPISLHFCRKIRLDVNAFALAYNTSVFPKVICIYS